MSSIVNYHVFGQKNIGDRLSAPVNYFDFPGCDLEEADIFKPKATTKGKHIILGGGGLLFSRFENSISELVSFKGDKKLIAWGVGQQVYGDFSINSIKSFNYLKYLDDFNLVGIRDFDFGYNWVPCSSCMNQSFDKKREIRHEFVVFSHKKFQLKIDSFPQMTNDVAEDIDQVLDFLASGETILTSSYHGAYWGILLGRKVLAFPFSSKFYTLKHKPEIYPVQKWIQARNRLLAKGLSLFNRLGYKFHYKNKYSCKCDDWQVALKNCRSYPESLQQSRMANQLYYAQVLQLLLQE